ncbi:bifunctional acetate--CoA ligase family protein/GNAT family N-acetyltransferase [Rugosimonospora africana]|uniref:GNAT family N-acetyltransferase n=1 Tax=Rugosimonospora africana TaxID=556532 RepID=A0A8J3R143_9ACTN|nr:bifunctional GNAT family N-acetyltransferase/acetate--CoA ligase family protein [Rugosimonospora africana]GIH21109.1 GNAT family N-acetyltransferase [Rugosimonospora africana]
MTTTDIPPVADPEPGYDALAADGAIVRIRPVTTTDGPALAELYYGGTAESLYRRFLCAGHGGVAAEVERLIRPADDQHAALVVVESDRIVGVASYERLPQPDRADFAVFVADSAHGRGLGTLLLERLRATARRHGITALHGDVLPSNSPMLQVAHDLGEQRLQLRDGLVDVDLPTDDNGDAALDDRDRQAERHSLTPLLAPRAVAVIGAGRRPGGIGHAVLAGLRDGGFTGPVYAINPRADQIADQPAYPSVAVAPGPVDLAVIAVPAPAVPDAIADCAAAKVPAAVILSSGFSEDGPAGRAAQAAIVRAARAAGIRLVGPNCLGILNTDPAVRLQATFASVTPPPGGLAIASQSGAVGITLLDHAARAGIGLSAFVSLGNKADVSGNDLLSYWYDDPATRAVALYLESLGNPRRFARIARALGRRKPVLVVKSGRTAAGSRAGASHTAAAAAPDATIDALFAQAGVIRCDGLGELLDAARLLVDQPLPGGPRLAIIGNAGGINVLATDDADRAGLRVPELPVPVRAELADLAPNASTVANPIDLGAAATPAAMAGAIEAVADSGAVDAILVVFAATLANDVPGVVAAIADAADHTDLPVATVLLGVPEPASSLGARRVPVYPLPEQAVTAFGHAAGYASWRRTPLGARPDLDGIDESGARNLVREALAGGGGWQPPECATALLTRYGIPVATGRVVTDADEAVRAATELGFPVVLKAADPSLVHKSDVGGVRLNLTGEEAVRVAYHAIAGALGVAEPPVLVQRQLPPGVELVAGIVHDPLFGSLVMLGIGGVHTDVLADRALRVLPLTDTDATRMWQGLKAARLLTGYRGAPAVDTAAVEDLLLRLGRLAEDLPEVAELDLNPILTDPDGVVAVDVKLRLAPIGQEPDAGIRALREPA